MAFQSQLKDSIQAKQFILYVSIVAIMVIGLSTQSVRTIAAYSAFIVALGTFGLILFLAKSRLLLSRVQTVYVFWMVAVVVVLPLFFSKSPILSLEFGYVVAFGSLLMFFITKPMAKVLLYALVLVSLADSIVSISQMLEGTQRAFGFYSDIALRTLYLWVSVVFIYITAFDDRKRWLIVGRYGLMGLLLFGLHTGQSFTVNFLVLVGYLLLGLYTLLRAPEQRWRYLWFVLIGLASYALYLVFAANVDVTGIRVLSNANSLNGRTPIYVSAWVLVKESPIFGVGSGLFMYLYPSIRTEWGSAGLNVHNDYLEYWATAGLVGALPLVFVAFYFIYRNGRSILLKQFDDFAFSGLLVSIMAFSFLNFFFWRLENFILLAALWRLMDGSESAETSLTGKSRIAVSLLMVLPFTVLTARLYEHFYVEFGPELTGKDKIWTEVVLSGDSGLLPYRASNVANALSKADGAVTQNDIDQVTSRLDLAIENRVIRAPVYCARVELGLAAGFSIPNTADLIAMGLARDPSDAYCQLIKYRASVTEGDLNNALSELRTYFLSVQARQQDPNYLNDIAKTAAFDAYLGGEILFAKYFSRVEFRR